MQGKQRVAMETVWILEQNPLDLKSCSKKPCYLSAFSKLLGSPKLALLAYKHQENDTHFLLEEATPSSYTLGLDVHKGTG